MGISQQMLAAANLSLLLNRSANWRESEMRSPIYSMFTMPEIAKELRRSESWLREAETKGKIPKARREHQQLACLHQGGYLKAKSLAHSIEVKDAK